jgi:beta-1,2-mannobiose phosphorylase / 1,2-beta-oligomannan phosphorylase
MFERLMDEPILGPASVPGYNTVFNPGACIVGDQTVLALRVEDRRGMSAIHIARSADGINGWVLDDEPLLVGDAADATCEWGFEDARLTRLDEMGVYAIACTAYGRGGPCVFLATTTDFRTVERIGIVIPPEDKNAAVFPRRIGDEWRLLHRPVVHQTGAADVWISSSNDLRTWGGARHVMGCRPGGWWDSRRIGTGPPPLETEAGWLLIYHGVRDTTSGSLYRVGLALLDLDEPHRVVARSDRWVLAPETPWERRGDVPNVVFPTGVTVVDGSVRLYYGAADTCVGIAACPLSDLLDALG